MAAIANKKGFNCGGTLVASKWIVSAAHCFFKDAGRTDKPYTPDELKVILGDHDKSKTEDSDITITIRIEGFTIHPQYNGYVRGKDIALVKLAEEVDLKMYAPACIANTRDTFTGKNAWVYGENLYFQMLLIF